MWVFVCLCRWMQIRESPMRNTVQIPSPLSQNALRPSGTGKGAAGGVVVGDCSRYWPQNLLINVLHSSLSGNTVSARESIVSMCARGSKLVTFFWCDFTRKASHFSSELCASLAVSQPLCHTVAAWGRNCGGWTGWGGSFNTKCSCFKDPFFFFVLVPEAKREASQQVGSGALVITRAIT